MQNRVFGSDLTRRAEGFPRLRSPVEIAAAYIGTVPTRTTA
jgi:hypothetical protein